MTVSGSAPWATVSDLPEAVRTLHTADVWDGYLGLATDIMWAATGRRWAGLSAPVTAVLVPSGPVSGGQGWPYRCTCTTGVGVLAARSVRGVVGVEVCGLGHEPVAVRLLHSDVAHVLSLTVDGAAFLAYQVDGGWVTRTDGGTWPADRAVITYQHGRQPPPTAIRMCALLAGEFGKQDAGDGKCSLPRRLQTISRQGLTAVSLDTMEFIDKGRIGILAIDAWLASVNPHGRARAATVWSPDVPRSRRVQ